MAVHRSDDSPLVIAGLDPAIHLFSCEFCEDGWTPGSSPGMTKENFGLLA
jgi:hypothetical protein